MERERKIKSMSLVAMIVAVLGLTVAFAALSQTLTINGSATIDAATWDIHYKAATGADTGKTKNTTTGAASAVNGDLTGTTVSNLSATLTRPGDSVTFYWDVENAGDINAYISSLVPATISNSNLTCTGTAQDSAVATSDANKVCSVLQFSFKYVDGDAVAANDTLTTAEGTKHLELKISYPSTVTNDNWPTADVNITFPTITTTYSQTLSNQ